MSSLDAEYLVPAALMTLGDFTEVLARVLELDVEKIAPEAGLADDLGLDSLDLLSYFAQFRT